jgi:hypothetical protein
MDEEKLSSLAGESHFAQKERAELEDKVKDLESALKTCLRAGMYMGKSCIYQVTKKLTLYFGRGNADNFAGTESSRGKSAQITCSKFPIVQSWKKNPSG